MICQECKNLINNADLFQCQKCKKISHIKCTLYNEPHSLCDVCRFATDIKVKCELCRKSTGMLKRFLYLKKEKWIHYTCSKWFNAIYFKNDNNFVIFYCDEKLKSETWLSDCYFCHKTTNDFLIKCDSNECKNYSHMKCLITKKLIQERDNKFFFLCDEHRNNINKVLIDNSYPSERNTNYDIILYKPSAPKKIQSENNKDTNIIKDKPKSSNESKMKYCYISTSIKCDLCCKRISSTEIDIKHCKQCFTYFHLSCEKSFYGQSQQNEICYKCSISENEKCFVCGYTKGSMAQCHQKWIHFLCAKAQRGSFYITQTKSKISQFKFDNYHHDTTKIRKCVLCSHSNSFTMMCEVCGIVVHPYCAFKADFDIEMKNGDVVMICDVKHRRYSKQRIIKKENSNHSNKTKSTMLSSPNDKSKKKKLKLNKLKKEFSLIRKNIFKEKLNSYQKYSYEKYIESVNFSYLKKKFITSGLINPLQISKINNITKFDWEITEPFFYDITKEDIERTFNISSLTSSESTNITSPPSLELNEEGQNEEKNNDDYIVCNIQKDKHSFYIMYNKSKISSMKENESYHSESTTNSNFTLISKKRGNVAINKEENKSLSKRLSFVKGFKLNNISHKILQYESLSNFNDSNDYVTSSIASKQKMLSLVTSQTQSIISKLLSVQSPSQSFLSKEDIVSLRRKYKSNTAYHNISSRLKHSSTITHITDIFPSNRKSNGLIQLARDQFKNDSECCVCFDINNDSDSSTQIIFCDKCNVSFHLSCYGIQNIPEGSYICDLCKSNIKNVECVICLHKGGAMKQISNEKWAHVTCVILSRHFYFDDYYLLTNIKQSESSEDLSICSECKRSQGEKEICECCGRPYHYFCIYFKGGVIQYEEKDKRMRFIIKQCSNENRDELKEIRKLIYQK